MFTSSLPLLAVAAATQVVLAAPSTVDPCTTIAGVKWAAPADVRACFECVVFCLQLFAADLFFPRSFPVNETLRANVRGSACEAMPC